MPTSPVKTRIPLTSFGHLITEVKCGVFFASPHCGAPNCSVLATAPPRPQGGVHTHTVVLRPFHRRKQPSTSDTKRQLFGIEAPTSVELTGWRKYFNSYTLQGRRNCVLVTYGIFAVTAAAYWMHRQNKKENQTSSSTP